LPAIAGFVDNSRFVCRLDASAGAFELVDPLRNRPALQHIVGGSRKQLKARQRRPALFQKPLQLGDVRRDASGFVTPSLGRGRRLYAVYDNGTPVRIVGVAPL
jgi:hypothetical protein